MNAFRHHIKNRLYVEPKMIAIRTANRLRGGLPIPPGRLIYTVGGTHLASNYLDIGLRGAESVRAILSKNNLKMEGFSHVLDWGVGVSRVFRYWKGVAGPEFHGTDYNPELIEWDRRNIPFGTFKTNPLEGPLDYPDASFDFVYALSVFTHLDEELQQYWIGEMGRIIKPGGYLLFSSHGEFYKKVLNEKQKTAYENGEFVVLRSDLNGENDCSAHHPERYVRQKLAPPLFEVTDYEPEGAKGNPRQDYWLLRRK